MFRKKTVYLQPERKGNRHGSPWRTTRFLLKGQSDANGCWCALPFPLIIGPLTKTSSRKALMRFECFSLPINLQKQHIIKMKKSIFLLTLAFIGGVLGMQAQTGGISREMLQQMRLQNHMTASDRAIRNAVANVDVNKLAVSADAAANFDTAFSNRVTTIGITDQKRSGRCWLFSGLNVLRAQAMHKHNLPETYFSQIYLFFYDQLEKSNLFLQSIIDTRALPLDDRHVEWLLKNPLSDGGTYTGVADLVMKYGLVPQNVMPENHVSNNTIQMATLLKLKLREFGMELRAMPSKTSDAAFEQRKQAMLSEIYHILTIAYGEPVTSFTWTRKNAKGEMQETKTYTPQEFYQYLLGEDLNANYVMLMNDPSRDYYQVYEIENDRHLYDGHNWLYVNLPMDDIKEVAIKSIKANMAMYFSCDVGKFLNSENGLLDVNNYDYGSLLGTTFGMDKKMRIQTFASGSSHAMTLTAVDLDKNGKPRKWLVENSWGPTYGYKGNLIMTDEWFDAYMFRVVVNKRFVSAKILNVLQQKSVMLPPWDPMFAEDE